MAKKGKKRRRTRAERIARRNEKRGWDPMYFEAKKVLLNQVQLDEDGHFITTTEVRFPLWGAADGENRTRFLGISRRTYHYSSSYNNTQAVFRAGKTMSNIGRGVNLRCDEDAAACVVRTYIFYPVVLVFYENDNDDLVLSAYTPRAFFSVFAIKLAMKKFDKSAEGILERQEEEERKLFNFRKKRDDEPEETDNDEPQKLVKEMDEEETEVDSFRNMSRAPFFDDDIEWASDDPELDDYDVGELGNEEDDYDLDEDD